MAPRPKLRIEALERENQAYRDILFAIVKHAGRVRVPMRLMGALGPGDRLDIAETDGEMTISYARD